LHYVKYVSSPIGRCFPHPTQPITLLAAISSELDAYALHPVHVCLSVCPVPVSFTEHCADVPFNWRQAVAATAASQQHAFCVSLCTLLGRTAVVSTTD